jgi:hypothetical protein
LLFRFSAALALSSSQSFASSSSLFRQSAWPPPQPITFIDPLPWLRSMATWLSLSELVTTGQLAANEDGRPAAWIMPQPNKREPNPPYDYVISFIRFHKRGFAALASRFMRALCYHYGVELQNFTPNAISQVATFVGVCEGFLGIHVNWDLWVHLFRAELHTLMTPEPKIHRAVRAGGMMIVLRNMLRELYIPCTMTSNNSKWERGWFYLRNDGAGLPAYSGKVLKDKADSWQDAAGFAPGRVEGPGGRRPNRGVRPREPLSLADRPPDGEAAPHLRDARGREPRHAGAVTVAAGRLPAGVRGHPGAMRHRPQGRPE